MIKIKRRFFSIIDNKKECKRCEEILPLTSFSKNNAAIYGSGYISYCKKCNAILSREYRQKNKSKVKTTMRRSKLKMTYGITEERYNQILEEQNGVCSICKSKPIPNRWNDARLHVDHDGISGAVRGLLCHNCNVGIGHFRNDILLLKSAIRYLNAGKDYRIVNTTPNI